MTDQLLFDLRIVDLARVHLHEQTDAKRVQRLAAYLQNDGFLRHPPIAAQVDDNYIILDGATRTTALRELGYAHSLVQVVPYGHDLADSMAHDVQLLAWYHVVSPAIAAGIQTWVERHPHLSTTHMLAADALLLLAEGIHTHPHVCGGLVFHNGTAVVFTVDPENGDSTIPSILRTIVSLYGNAGIGEIHRIVHNELLQAVYDNTSSTSAMVFPTFTPEYLTQCALAGDLLPAGITRHTIPGRALGLNVSLDMLYVDAEVDSKNRWLQEVLRKKVLDKKVRYYDEAVFVFDD